MLSSIAQGTRKPYQGCGRIALLGSLLLTRLNAVNKERVFSLAQFSGEPLSDHPADEADARPTARDMGCDTAQHPGNGICIDHAVQRPGQSCSRPSLMITLTIGLSCAVTAEAGMDPGMM